MSTTCSSGRTGCFEAVEGMGEHREVRCGGFGHRRAFDIGGVDQVSDAAQDLDVGKSLRVQQVDAEMCGVQTGRCAAA